MKNFYKFLLVVVALLVFAACGSTDSGSSTTETSDNGNGNDGDASVETKVLKASSGVTDEHFWDRGFFSPLLEAIEEGSNGEVKFDKFIAGELVELGNELEALQTGSIDVSLTTMGPYDPQRFPYTEVVMLPTLGSDAEIVTQSIVDLMQSDQELADGKTFYQIEFEDKGLVAFPNAATEPYVISTTRQKFESKDDFSSSLRLRTASRVHEILSEVLGITGQTMPITDSYDALSRNALDGIIYNAPDWTAFGFDELIKHTITDVNLGHFVGYTSVTQETWDTFSPELQQLFEEKAYEIVHQAATLTKGETDENVEANIEKGGELTAFNDLNAELQDHLAGAVVETWEKWIDILESDGYAGTEIAKLWRDLLVDNGATLPQEILDL